MSVIYKTVSNQIIQGHSCIKSFKVKVKLFFPALRSHLMLQGQLTPHHSIQGLLGQGQGWAVKSGAVER
jgi:hypothetical protein